MPTEGLHAAGVVVSDSKNISGPGVSLEGPAGARLVSVLNQCAARSAAAGGPVFPRRDGPPPVTRHFQAQGGAWPPHCIQGTRGAEFHPDLRLPPGTLVVSTGQDPDEDGYSAFPSTLADGRALSEALREAGVRRLYVGGLATDYCVKATVLDAITAGFEATLLVDASRGVNLQPHDAEAAIEAMVGAGAATVTLGRLSERG